MIRASSGSTAVLQEFQLRAERRGRKVGSGIEFADHREYTALKAEFKDYLAVLKKP